MSGVRNVRKLLIYGKPKYIYVDASAKSVGSATYQKDEEGRMRPVALLSAMVNETQQKYTSNERKY